MAEFLITPVQAVDMEVYLQTFRWAEIEITTRRPAQLEDIPDLPDRIRGAFGRALERSPEDHGGNYWAAKRPQFWEIAFGSPLNTSIGELPRPFVIQTDLRSDTLTVRLRLAGVATNYCDYVAATMLQALRNGIKVKSQSDLRIPIDNCAVSTEWKSGISWPSVGQNLFLRFLAPVAIRRKGIVVDKFENLPETIFQRVRGLARWGGMDIFPPADALKRDFLALEMLAEDLMWQHWLRWSSNHREKPLLMSGLVGHLHFRGKLDRIMPLIAFGEVFHIGSGTAFGLGRITATRY